MRKFALIAAATLIAFPAFAQDTTVPVGSLFGSFKPYLVEIVSILAACLVAYVGKVAKDKFGIDIEASHRQALQTAIENAAGLLIAKAGDATSALKIDVKSPQAAAAINYVTAAVPDALKYFGITPDAIGDKIKAKIGILAA